MKRQALLVIVTLAFASTSFAAVRDIASVSQQRQGLPQPKGSKQADCAFPSRKTLQEAKWILPSGNANVKPSNTIAHQTGARI